MATATSHELTLRDATQWSCFIFGIFDISTVRHHVEDPKWQKVRLSMLNTTLEVKYDTLYNYLLTEQMSEHSKICVTNYVNALKRGGLIK